MNIIPIEPNDRFAAAGLLAERHAADRSRERGLPLQFESPKETLPLVDAILDDPEGSGVMAWQDGRPVGYLAGYLRTLEPASVAANFQRPQSAVIPYTGHALAPGTEAEVYRELYAALAPAWVERGHCSHYVEVSAFDFTAAEAFHSLGFGRDVTLALRPVATPVATPEIEGIEIHLAGTEDLEVVAGLADLLMRHHAGSPCFQPYLPETTPAAREMLKGLLAGAESPHFVGYRDGEALGMQTFMPPRLLSPLATPERTIYLFEGVVAPEARGGGIGRTLLSRSMGWAQGNGYVWCALHYFSANLSGARFWQASGFRPLSHRLFRQVDERNADRGAAGSES